MTDPARREELRRLYGGSAWGILALLLPVILVLVATAPWLVRVWLGESYVTPGATVLRVLAPGVLLTAVAHVPVAFLQAGGRADVSGRLHVIMAALHLALMVVLVVRYGAVGAAAAWSTRAAIDVVISFWLARRVLGLSVGRAIGEPRGGAAHAR